jgi:hypothetical protein
VPSLRLAVLAVALAAVSVARPAHADEPPWPTYLGLQLGADSPGGALAALTLTPGVPWARVHAGLTWNYYAFGVQGGATVMPWRGRVTPTLTVAVGRSFDADLRSALSGLNIPSEYRGSLSSVGYDYVSAMLGLEIGSPTGGAFFVRGGLSRVWSTLDGVTNAQSPGTTVNTSPVDVTAWVPAMDLGYRLRLW